jgi:phosphorylcholine metabolism protein LicD
MNQRTETKLLFQGLEDKTEIRKTKLMIDFFNITHSENLQRYYLFRRICLDLEIISETKDTFIFSKKKFLKFIGKEKQLKRLANG